MFRCDLCSECLSAKTKMTIIVVFHQALRSSVIPLVTAIPSSGRGRARTPFQGPCLLWQKAECMCLHSAGVSWSGALSFFRDEWARRRRQILAIDAEHYTQGRDQYNMHSVLRELNKVEYIWSTVLSDHKMQNYTKHYLQTWGHVFIQTEQNVVKRTIEINQYITIFACLYSVSQGLLWIPANLCWWTWHCHRQVGMWSFQRRPSTQR